MCSVDTTGMRRSPSKPQDVAAVGSAEDAVLVLQAGDVHLVHVEELGGQPVVGQAGLVQLEADLLRVGVAAGHVVHDHGPEGGLGRLLRQRLPQIGGERGDAAAPRRVVAEEGDLVEAGSPARSAARVPLIRRPTTV